MSRRNVLLGSRPRSGLRRWAAGTGGLLLASSGSSSRNAVPRASEATLTERAPAIPAGASFAELARPRSSLPPRLLPDRRRPADPHPDGIGLAATMPTHGRQGDHLTFADLMSRPLVERTITLTCVSNPVGGNLISTPTSSV